LSASMLQKPRKRKINPASPIAENQPGILPALF